MATSTTASAALNASPSLPASSSPAAPQHRSPVPDTDPRHPQHPHPVPHHRTEMPRAPRPRAAKAAPGPSSSSTGYTPAQISRHIGAYFRATPPGAWDFEAFTAHCRTHAHFAAKKTPAMVNYWLTELKNIVSAEGGGEAGEREKEREKERRERASAAQEEWRARGRKKLPRYTATNSIVVHGDIINSSVANIAGGTEPAPAAPAAESEPEPVPEPVAGPAAEEQAATGPAPAPDTDDDRLPTLPPTDITAPGTFLQRFPTMMHKVSLTAAKVLEDTLHSHLLQTPATPVLLLTHGIIDRNDAATAALFTTAEMKMISELAPPPPAQDAAFEYACDRYMEEGEVRGDIEWYRVVSETPPRPAGVPYDRAANFNATYVNHAVGAVLGNMEHLAEMCSFAPEPNEGWFDANIWAPLIDYCFKDLHGVSLSRCVSVLVLFWLLFSSFPSSCCPLLSLLPLPFDLFCLFSPARSSLFPLLPPLPPSPFSLSSLLSLSSSPSSLPTPLTPPPPPPQQGNHVPRRAALPLRWHPAAAPVRPGRARVRRHRGRPQHAGRKAPHRQAQARARPARHAAPPGQAGGRALGAGEAAGDGGRALCWLLGADSAHELCEQERVSAAHGAGAPRAHSVRGRG
ncbi:hypothetical protein DFP73DRAFT_206675 [Morchella snyderi]|nr:hypothetical protein DFP73DRAFT_206675 [Morchella snyderi]